MHYLITLKQPIACENGRMCAKIWREMNHDDLKRLVPDDNFLGAIEHPTRPTAPDVYCCTPMSPEEQLRDLRTRHEREVSECREVIRQQRKELADLINECASLKKKKVSGLEEAYATAAFMVLEQGEEAAEDTEKLQRPSEETMRAVYPEHANRDRAVLSDAIREAIASLELHNYLGWRKSAMRKVAVDLRSALLDTAL